MIQINVYKSDKLYDLNFTLKDANDVAFDLTGYSGIIFRAQKQGAAAAKFSGAATVVGAATLGTIKYTVQATDFDEAGDYYAEVEVTYTGGKVVTLGDIVVRVKPELPR